MTWVSSYGVRGASDAFARRLADEPMSLPPRHSACPSAHRRAPRPPLRPCSPLWPSPRGCYTSVSRTPYF